jgi:hypothetical protein
MKVPVCWHAQKEGRGYYNCTSMCSDLFDFNNCGPHYGAWDRMPNVEGAIIVLHGGREMGRIDKLNMDIEKLQWCLIIALGDEESTFPLEQIEHPNKILWVQEPLPGRPAHDAADRYILDGYPHDYRRHMVKCEKDLDWVLACQMTHVRRWQCRNALQGIDWGGVLVESKGYCQGVSRDEYFRLMARAKIAPCPSGPFSPDSARVCEALECGCVPILDDLSPTRSKPGFWKLVLGQHPIPVVESWDTLRDEIEDIKAQWKDYSQECQGFWRDYKEKFFGTWLAEDLAKLGVAHADKV